MNEIENYEDLETAIKEHEKEIERLNDAQRNYEMSNAPQESKNSVKKYVEEQKAKQNEELEKLVEIQNAYNTMEDLLNQIQDVDQDKLLSRELAQEKIEELQKRVIDIRGKIPEKLQEEIRNKILQSKNSPRVTRQTVRNEMLADEEVIDYKKEYESLIKEYDKLFADVDIRKVGLKNIDELIAKLNGIDERRKKLLSGIDKDRADFEENELRELLNVDHDFAERIRINSGKTNRIKRGKEEQKKLNEEEIRMIRQSIALARHQIKNSEEIIEQLKARPDLSDVISIYEDTIKRLKEKIEKDEKRILQKSELNDILENGGEIKFRPRRESTKEMPKVPNPPNVKPEEEQKEDQTMKAPEIHTVQPTMPGTPGPRQVPPKRTEPKMAGSKPSPKVKPETLEGLIKSGVLPSILSETELMQVCSKLNIKISGPENVLTPEQIERLKSDHLIKNALLNQRIIERNKTKVEEYDKLISKYQSILDDKLSTTRFTPKYIDKVKSLLEKCKTERKEFLERNERITGYYRGETLTGLATSMDESLEKRANKKNDKLRQKYEELDALRVDRERLSSKFRIMLQDTRIKFVLKRIEALKGKESKLSSKQVQVVNKNTENYIKKVAVKIARYLEQQKRIEQSVERISNISNRIDQNMEERNKLAFDKQVESKLFDKIGSTLEDKRLQVETMGLEAQRGLEDLLGRSR